MSIVTNRKLFKFTSFKYTAIVAFLPLLLPLTARAASNIESVPYIECFYEAAARYSVEPALLIAIADVESGFNASAINQRIGSDRDVGLMQIWSDWLPKLAKYRITEKELLNPCVSANVGAWILSENFAFHTDSNTAIGAYNAGFSAKNEAIRARYVKKVLPKLHHYRMLTATKQGKQYARY